MSSTITLLRKDFYLFNINGNQLKQNISKALEILGLDSCEITIIFISRNRMQNLKKAYLGIDELTDVLSFESGEINPESGNQYLGDIAISPMKALKQARKKHINFNLEILTLCIHGLLHLVGYDHSSKSDEVKMFKQQDYILGEICKI